MQSTRTRTRSALLVCGCLSLLLGVGAKAANPPKFALAQSIPNPNAMDGDQFGYSVAMAGNNLLVGAPKVDMGATDAGAAYLFDGANGTLLQTFQKTDPAAGDWFGISVAAVGSNVLIGALGDDTGATDAGAAFLFDGTTGAPIRTFQKPSVHAADWFGGAVAALGSNILVGAPLDHVGEIDAGGAYLLDATTGALLQSFHKPMPASGEWFGVSLAAVGESVLVGAMLDHSVAKDAGCAYHFDGKTGALLRTFQKPKPAVGDWFGASVAVMDTSLLVGAPMGRTVIIGASHDSTGKKDAGAVYLFDVDSGHLIHSLQNPAPIAGELFGSAVAVVGTDILVGAPGDGSTKGGAVYRFDGVTGAWLQTFQNPTPAADDMFGFSLAGAPNRVLIGAPGDHSGTNLGGAAFLFKS
jgi:hypothetical protein